MTDVLLARRLVYRFQNWNLEDTPINPFARAASPLQDRPRRILLTPWTSSFTVNLVIRSEFRAMYFVHSHSIAYNYNVVSHMLVRGTEERFVLNNVVQLCPMFDRDDNNDEDYMYPLYAEDCRHRWWGPYAWYGMCWKYYQRISMTTSATTIRTTRTTIRARCALFLPRTPCGRTHMPS